MNKKILKVIAFLQLFVVAIFFLGFMRFSKGTIVYPVLLKVILYAILALLSGIGIIFNKKILFLSTIYLYPFLVLERLDRVFVLFNSYKVNISPDRLRNIYVGEIITAGILISFYLGIIMLVFSKNVRTDYHIEQKSILINLAIAFATGFFLVRAY